MRAQFAIFFQYLAAADNLRMPKEGADLDPAACAAREQHSRPAASPGGGGGRHRDGAEGQRVQVDLPQQHRLANLLYRPVIRRSAHIGRLQLVGVQGMPLNYQLLNTDQVEV